MGNRLRHRYTSMAERAVPYIVGAAIIAAPLISLNCRKDDAKDRMAEQRAPASVGNAANEIRNSLVLFAWFGENIEKDRPAILREYERIGGMLKDFGPGEMLRLYRLVEKDMKEFDGKRRGERKAGLIEMCGASLSYARERGDVASVEARIGSVIFALPFLPDIMSDRMDKQLSSRGYYWAIGTSYMKLLGKQRAGFETVSHDLEGWALGRKPFSDDSLLFLFATIREAADYQHKAR